MTANSVTCIYCKHPIVWNEFAGWLLSTDEERFGVYHTNDCPDRPESEGGPAASHCSEWAASLRERFPEPTV